MARLKALRNQDLINAHRDDNLSVDSARAMEARADYHNLFVAGLTHSCTNAHLMDLFVSFNPIKATVMMDVETGRSKRFAFVLFSSEDDGRAAVATLNDAAVPMPGGKSVSLHVSASKFDGFVAAQETSGVYVRNVPQNVSADEIRTFYSQFGAVQGVEMRAGPNNSNLVALRFDSVEAARAAIDASHGKRPFGRDPAAPTAPLMAKYADHVPRIERGTAHPNRRRKSAPAAPPSGGSNRRASLSDAGTLVSLTPSATALSVTPSPQQHIIAPTPNRRVSLLTLDEGIVLPGKDEVPRAHSPAICSESATIESNCICPSRRSSAAQQRYRHDPYSPQGFQLAPEI